MAWLVVWFCGRFGWLSVWLVSWLVGLFGCVVGGLVDRWDCLLVAYSGQLIGLLYNGLGIDFLKGKEHNWKWLYAKHCCATVFLASRIQTPAFSIAKLPARPVVLTILLELIDLHLPDLLLGKLLQDLLQPGHHQ